MSEENGTQSHTFQEICSTCKKAAKEFLITSNTALKDKTQEEKMKEEAGNDDKVVCRRTR